MIKSFISILFKHSMLLPFSVVTQRLHSFKNTISYVHRGVQAHFWALAALDVDTVESS